MNQPPAPRPNPNEKLVRVFDTEQESEALVVHGLLQSTGIDSDITSLDAQQDILPGVGGTIILVRVMRSRGGMGSHGVPFSADEIEERKQVNPHEVDEMPIQRADIDSREVLLREIAAEVPDEHPTEHRHPDEDVE